MDTLARIEKLAYGGDGIARVDGKVVFIPFTAPGDLVRIRISKEKKGFARGSVLEIVEQGPDRRDPPCPHFGTCGGCQLQHLTYSRQLEAKAAMVGEALERIAKIKWPAPIEIAGRPDAEFKYRIRCVAHVDPKGKMGFYAAHSHSVVDIESCPLLVEALDDRWRKIRAKARKGGSRDVALAVGDDGSEHGSKAPSMSVGGHTYTFGAESFFQVNAAMLETLVGMAIGDERGEAALDLYSGVGLFTIPLARRFSRVVAVEIESAATRYARANLEANGATNVELSSISVEKWLERYGRSSEFDLVLLDPPRGGLGPEVTQRLADLVPARVVYVSCDPSTLARDLRALVDRGYRLDSVQALDLFPQTYHVETIARLSRAV